MNDDVTKIENNPPVQPAPIGGPVEAPRFTETPPALSEASVANVVEIGGQEVPPQHPDIVTSNLETTATGPNLPGNQVSYPQPETIHKTEDQIAQDIKAPYLPNEAREIIKTEKTTDGSRKGLAIEALRAVLKIFRKPPTLQNQSV